MVLKDDGYVVLHQAVKHLAADTFMYCGGKSWWLQRWQVTYREIYPLPTKALQGALKACLDTLFHSGKIGHMSAQIQLDISLCAADKY